MTWELILMDIAQSLLGQRRRNHFQRNLCIYLVLLKIALWLQNRKIQRYCRQKWKKEEQFCIKMTDLSIESSALKNDGSKDINGCKNMMHRAVGILRLADTNYVQNF